MNCQRCKGAKRLHIRVMNHGTKEMDEAIVTCPMCDGKGFTDQSDHARYLRSVIGCPPGGCPNQLPSK